jgi:alginate O-acetyltransferase complex protein AlgI
MYLLQFPLMAAGPIIRFRDFSGQLDRRSVSMGAFGFGVRRFVTGWVKLALVAGTLSGPVDRIFALPSSRVTPDAAWLAAVCFSLQVYFQCSGCADMAIGLGRLFGFRYPENFRRPYTATSIREFWRRWNITLLVWLRDYLYLPIVGHDRPTPRLFVNLFAGFCLVGLWHGGGSSAFVWALYFSTLLALEAVGLGARIERAPRAVAHAYVLAAVLVGWVMLRAHGAASAGTFLSTLVGWGGASGWTASAYVTWQVALAFVAALVGAAPMIRAISRWRVMLDAATMSTLMMVAATAVFMWRPVAPIVAAIWPGGRRRA